MEGKERNILEAQSEFEAKLQLMNKMKPKEQLQVKRRVSENESEYEGRNRRNNY